MVMIFLVIYLKILIAKLKFDRTYRSIIKAVTPKGYVILDDSGSERTVKCCIPGVELKVGQNVWVKVPMGDLNGIHIWSGK